MTKLSKMSRNYDPSATIEGIMVEQQLEKGLEIIIGGRIDPAFGKVITIGMGGTLVELIKDISIRVLPITTSDINAMIYDLNGYPLIKGYRNEPPRDLQGLIDLIDTIARFFMDSTDIVEFDINPVFLYEHGVCAVDARFYTDDTVRPEQPDTSLPLSQELHDIKSIALVGASAEPNKVGYAVLRNLLSFPGALYPVNPKHQKILGRTTYPSLTSIPGPVDIAVVVVPAGIVPSIVEEAGKKGIPLVIIISSGFRESGAAGIELEDRVVALAQHYNIRIMGPNCLGIMLPHQGINTTFDPVSPKPGNLAFLSQSGAIITTMVDWSLPEEIGFSEVISVGNQADLTFEDYILFAAG